jgi:hypothetical protein
MVMALLTDSVQRSYFQILALTCDRRIIKSPSNVKLYFKNILFWDVIGCISGLPSVSFRELLYNHLCFNKNLAFA